jgi:hypothetical protein
MLTGKVGSTLHRPGTQIFSFFEAQVSGIFTKSGTKKSGLATLVEKPF